jgi:hypothetical protein
MIEQLTDGLNIEARPFQLRIAEKSIRILQGSGGGMNAGSLPPASVLIHSPTGSGKTIIGLMIARYLQREVGVVRSVGWVAMRRNLLAQAAAENHDREFHVDMELSKSRIRSARISGSPRTLRSSVCIDFLLGGASPRHQFTCEWFSFANAIGTLSGAMEFR